MTAQLVDSKGQAHFVSSATVYEPISGVWFISGKLLDEGSSVSGACVFRCGGAEWHGTVVPEFSGEWGTIGTFRLVAGNGGWGKRIKSRGYHNDGGVKGRTVATDAARDCGETLGAFDGSGSLGLDYARPSGLASVTLEDVAGMASWWVGRDGITRVGTRYSTAWKGVLDWDPESHLATLAGDDLARLEVGASLVDERIGAPKQIRDLEIRIAGSAVRAYAWCGGGEDALGRLPRLLRAIVQRVTEGPLWGAYRYKVVSMAPDGRVNLQVVRKSSGVPDLLPVTQWPGVAGAYAELADGAEVLVEFEEGDRGRPFIAHFTPRDGGGHSPESISFCGGSRPGAGVGDRVEIFASTGVPIAFTGMVGVPPAATPLVGTFILTAPLMGVISTGSSRVRFPR